MTGRTDDPTGRARTTDGKRPTETMSDDLTEDVHSGVFDTTSEAPTDQALNGELSRREEAERLVANSIESGEKVELAATIVANSDDYNSLGAVYDAFPTVASLRTKKNQVARHVPLPSDGVAANAEEELDDDLADDISTGVFE